MSEIKKVNEEVKTSEVIASSATDSNTTPPDVAPPTFPEPKPEDVDSRISRITSSILEGLLPGLIAAIRPQPNLPKNVLRMRRETERCLECQQLRSACEGKHVKMICYPSRYTKTGDYFRGCGLNGIWYLSNNENHFVTIPAFAEADFLKMIRNYEDREVSAMTSRKGEWDFGTIGQGARAKMPNPAKIGWN